MLDKSEVLKIKSGGFVGWLVFKLALFLSPNITLQKEKTIKGFCKSIVFKFILFQCCLLLAESYLFK